VSDTPEDQSCEQYAVCPFCKHHHRDFWEHEEDQGKADCEECGKEFVYCRNVSVTYDTSAPKPK
jgi:hypothetical protein